MSGISGSGSGGGGNVPITLTGNSGGVVPPTAGNFNIIGAGGVLVAGNPGTSTLTITAGATLPVTLTGDDGNAVPPTLDNINILGSGCTVTGNIGTSTLTITVPGATSATYQGNSGGVVSPTGGGLLNIVGAGGVTVAGSLNTLTITAPAPGSLTLTGNSGGAIGPDGGGNINIVGSGGVLVAGAGHTLTITAASSALTFTEDVGSATPAANAIIMAGGSNMNTSGAGNTVTINLDESIDQPNTNNTGTQGLYSLGGTPFLHNFSNNQSNTFVGGNAGNLTLSTARFNVGVGSSALHALTTGGTNCAIGNSAALSLTTGSGNVIIGQQAGETLTTQNDNTLIGNSAANAMAGARNIIIGNGAGDNYVTGGTNDNILLGNAGVDAESGIIRVGTAGTHNNAYLSGVYNVTPGGATVQNVVIDNNGQLGTGGGAAADAFLYRQNMQFFMDTPFPGNYYMGTTVPMTKIFDRGGTQFIGDTFTASKSGIWYFEFLIAVTITRRNVDGNNPSLYMSIIVTDSITPANSLVYGFSRSFTDLLGGGLPFTVTPNFSTYAQMNATSTVQFSIIFNGGLPNTVLIGLTGTSTPVFPEISGYFVST